MTLAEEKHLVRIGVEPWSFGGTLLELISLQKIPHETYIPIKLLRVIFKI